MTQRHRTTRFALGFIIAAAGILGISRVLETPKAQKRTATRPVVVVRQDIQEGHPIDRTSVAVVPWPVGAVPVGAYSAVDSVVGRVVRVNTFKGEVIMPGRLADAPVHEPPRQPPLTNY